MWPQVRHTCGRVRVAVVVIGGIVGSAPGQQSNKVTRATPAVHLLANDRDAARSDDQSCSTHDGASMILASDA